MKKSSLMIARIAGFALAAALAPAVAAQDFTLTLQPNSVTLIPDKTASFLVSLTPVGGFTSRVELAVGTLPSGVSASFSPNPVTLPGTSVLTLSATTNAALGAFTLDVTGVGGGITNTTSSSVTVNFGLLPLCTGGFRGTVTDIETGLPVPGATVYKYFLTLSAVEADASGQYIFTNLELLGDNLPASYSLFASRTDYWASATVYDYAVCDVTNTINFQLLRLRFGSISGTVTDPDGHLLPGVSVSLSGPSSVSTNSDANGLFQSGPLMLGPSNSPAAYDVTGTTNGYWYASTNTTVVADSNSVVHLVMIPICTATVTGRIVYGDTGLPATNVSVQVMAGNSAGSTNTDANGGYAVPGISLGLNNTPDFADIMANVPGYNYGQTNAPVTNCLEVVVAPTLVLQPLPRNNYGSVAGHVYDVETGLPVTNALVEARSSASGEGGSARGDTNGAYLVTNVLVGAGSTITNLAGVNVAAAGYYPGSSNFTLFAGQIVTQDVRILRIRFGEVAGVARDSATHLPLPNVQVNVLGGAFPIGPLVTGADGRYDTGPMQLNFPNAPTMLSLSASVTGYWTANTNTTIRADTTNVVDIEMIQVCTGATIIGNVVSATTQKPITNAIVSASSQAVQTDAGGNFILTNVTVGNNNSPIQTTVTATAPGFIEQSHTITIFCDATITTEFGAPQTVFGGIDGYVTNLVTGLPLTNVFVGTEFGAAASTDTNGYYSLSQVPLGANGASRVWTVTAIPNGFPAQTKSVSVSSNTVSRLDFGFGQPATALIVTATGAPNPVTVGSNLVYLVMLTNTVAEAEQVQLSDALPPGVTFVSAAFTNSPGTPLSAPVYSNHVVTATAPEFGSNSAVTLAIRVTPTVVGLLTNVATVSSSTPDLDPSGSNHTATVITSVVGPADADLALILSENTASIGVGSNILYTLVATNLGPADATDVVLDDTLPPSAQYVSSTTSQGTVTPNGGSVHWDFGALSSHGFATATLVATTTATGSITNSATVTLVPKGVAVVDPNLSNNTASVVAIVTAPVVTNVPPPTALIVTATGAPNPVTVGSNLLYLVRLTNSVAEAQQVQLSDALPPGVTFVSAAFTNSPGTPFTAPVYSNNLVTAAAAELGSNSAVALAILVRPAVTGLLTNVAQVSSSTPDLDLTGSNHTATVVTTVIAPVVTNVPPPTNVAVQALGPITFNPQTGLYQQSVLFTNLSGVPAAAVRVAVLGLPSSVVLYNAAGSTNGAPFVEYDQTVPAGGGVVFLLEYYDATRQSFVSTNFVATAVAAAAPPAPSGTMLQLDRAAFLSEGQLTIEFASVPGKTYVVQYSASADAQQWQTAVPPIVAVGTKTQWIDSGPPKTVSPPGPPGQRFYRVVQTN